MKKINKKTTKSRKNFIKEKYNVKNNKNKKNNSNNNKRY